MRLLIFALIALSIAGAFFFSDWDAATTAPPLQIEVPKAEKPESTVPESVDKGPTIVARKKERPEPTGLEVRVQGRVLGKTISFPPESVLIEVEPANPDETQRGRITYPDKGELVRLHVAVEGFVPLVEMLRFEGGYQRKDVLLQAYASLDVTLVGDHPERWLVKHWQETFTPDADGVVRIEKIAPGHTDHLEVVGPRAKLSVEVKPRLQAGEVREVRVRLRRQSSVRGTFSPSPVDLVKKEVFLSWEQKDIGQDQSGQIRIDPGGSTPPVVLKADENLFELGPLPSRLLGRVLRVRGRAVYPDHEEYAWGELVNAVAETHDVGELRPGPIALEVAYAAPPWESEETEVPFEVAIQRESLGQIGVSVIHGRVGKGEKRVYKGLQNGKIGVTPELAQPGPERREIPTRGTGGELLGAAALQRLRAEAEAEYEKSKERWRQDGWMPKTQTVSDRKGYQRVVLAWKKRTAIDPALLIKILERSLRQPDLDEKTRKDLQKQLEKALRK